MVDGGFQPAKTVDLGRTIHISFLLSYLCDVGDLGDFLAHLCVPLCPLGRVFGSALIRVNLRRSLLLIAAR